MGTVSRGFKGRRRPSSVQALGQGRLANKGLAAAVFAIMAKRGEGAHG